MNKICVDVFKYHIIKLFYKYCHNCLKLLTPVTKDDLLFH